jgi:hypothetical protein
MMMMGGGSGAVVGMAGVVGVAGVVEMVIAVVVVVVVAAADDGDYSGGFPNRRPFGPNGFDTVGIKLG